MKAQYLIILSSLMAMMGFAIGVSAQAEPNSERHKVHHVVIVWLKKPGDDEVRRQYIDESKRLAKLPGVLSYDVGVPAVIKRAHTSAALDESYDLAISSTHESQQAFEGFLKNPEYVRVAQQVLKPLVDKYRVYDFVE